MAQLGHRPLSHFAAHHRCDLPKADLRSIGFEGRYDYTASGRSVDLAARLCDRADDVEILLSHCAYTAAEDDFEATSNGEASLKGIREPVEIFGLLDATEKARLGTASRP